MALDTETTGMSIEAGNRLISIGCVEIVGRTITKRTFYQLINPEREVEEGAAKVHGYTWDKLKGKPYFVDIVDVDGGVYHGQDSLRGPHRWWQEGLEERHRMLHASQCRQEEDIRGS